MDEGAAKKRLFSVLIGRRFVHSNEKSPIARTIFLIFILCDAMIAMEIVRCLNLAQTGNVN